MHCTPVRRRGMDPHADDETALEYAMLAGDIDLAAQLLPQLAQRAYNSGRVGSLRRWFEALDQGGVPLHHSDVAVVGAILFSLLDDPVQADHWAQYLSDTPPDSARDAHANGDAEVRPSLPVSERRRADARGRRGCRRDVRRG